MKRSCPKSSRGPNAPRRSASQWPLSGTPGSPRREAGFPGERPAGTLSRPGYNRRSPVRAEQPAAGEQLGEMGSPGLSPSPTGKETPVSVKTTSFDSGPAVAARPPEPTPSLGGRNRRRVSQTRNHEEKDLERPVREPLRREDRTRTPGSLGAEPCAFLGKPSSCARQAEGGNFPETSLTKQHVQRAASSPGDAATQSRARPDAPLLLPLCPFPLTDGARPLRPGRILAGRVQGSPGP